MPLHLSEVGTSSRFNNVLSIILERFEKAKSHFYYIQGNHGTLSKRKQKYRNYALYAYSFDNFSYAYLIIQFNHVINSFTCLFIRHAECCISI